MPLQLRHDYAAGLHRGLPIDDINRPRSSRHRDADAHCNPAHIRQVWSWWLVLERLSYAGSLSLYLPVLLAGHSGHLTVLTRPGFVRAACHLSLCPLGSGCPQLLLTRCDEWAAVSFHHGAVPGASWRSISAHQSSFGSHDTKCRLMRSLGFSSASSAMVVITMPLPRVAPLMPSSRMSLSTVQRATWWPALLSATQSFLAP